MTYIQFRKFVDSAGQAFMLAAAKLPDPTTEEITRVGREAYMVEIRRGLIAAGWTPPDEKGDAKS